MTEFAPEAVVLTGFLNTAFRLAVPLVFAALGGVLSERSGVFNIGLEGMILGGAFGAALGAFKSGSPFVGLLIGISFGLLLGLILALLSVSLKVNQIIAGVALNLFTLGLAAFLSRTLIGPQAGTTILTGLSPVRVPGLASIPVVGPILFNQDLLVYAIYFIVPALYFLIFRTSWGLNIRAVGENPRAADAAGISVTGVRYLCVVGSGALASLGGCYLVLCQVLVFSEHMSAGKGYIALAAVILARWNPVGALLAGLLFGFFDALQLRLQFANPDVPYQIFAALPYVVSILALIGVVGRVSPPRAIGTAYRREAR